MRPMHMEFPGDPACEFLDRQYMLGSRILVAPVFSPDGRQRFYLPEGSWQHLLSGEKATFDNKVPMNAYVKVTQSQKLGGAVPDASNHNVIKYDDSEGYGNIGNYYTTSYSVYDEKSKKYIVEDTPYSIRYADGEDYEAVDSRTGTDNGFYFSNYTGDVDDINSAMTVEFTNEVAVGTLRVQKQLKDQSTSKAKFTFRVKLGRIFGTTDPKMDTLEEIPNLEYRVYNSSGEPTTLSESFYDTSKGIVLLAGEYATSTKLL